MSHKINLVRHISRKIRNLIFTVSCKAPLNTHFKHLHTECFIISLTVPRDVNDNEVCFPRKYGTKNAVEYQIIATYIYTKIS